MSYLDLLRDEPLKTAKVENVTVAPGAEKDLFVSDGTPGVVESLWMAVTGGGHPMLDGRLRVYYGTDPAAVDVDLGMLLGTHWGGNGVNGNQTVSVDYVDGTLGFLLKVSLPYGMEKIRVAYANIATPAGESPQTASIYSIAYYRPQADDPGRRLRATGARWWDQARRREKGDTALLANLTGAGNLAYLAYVGGVDATNRSWMERNLAVTVDGARTIETSGTEDTFDSAWYYRDRKNYRVGPDSFVGTDMPVLGGIASSIVMMATDFVTKFGGIRYTKSCKVEWLTESVVTTGDRYGWALLYYADVATA